MGDLGVKKLLVSLMASVLTVAAVPGHAATIVSSRFDTSSEGWRAGEFTQVQPSVDVTYNATARLISSGDVASNAGFLAPASYLGDKSNAFGGTLSFDLATASFDNAPYSAVALIGGGLTLYSLFTRAPATTLTPFSFSLVGSSFKTSNPFGSSGMTATDGQLRQALGSLEQLSILVDWQSGDDFTQLDNVTLADGAPVSGVPEPASWAMMLSGFGLLGAAMRRRGQAVVSLG